MKRMCRLYKELLSSVVVPMSLYLMLCWRQSLPDREHLQQHGTRVAALVGVEAVHHPSRPAPP